MKQKQAKKETPRTNDKTRMLGVRVDEQLHKECLNLKKGRGSAWIRKVLMRAVLADERGIDC
jgi:hypothetical protein